MHILVHDAGSKHLPKGPRKEKETREKGREGMDIDKPKRSTGFSSQKDLDRQ